VERTLQTIVEDDRTNFQKAEECLVRLSELPPTADLAFSQFQTGAFTFALLAVVEELQDIYKQVGA